MKREWLPIASAPTDDQEFLVGMWDGEKVWSEDFTTFKWLSQPVWKFCVSHHENPNGPYSTRGWNHRNGPFGGKATHWTTSPIPPKFDEVVFEKEEK